MSDLNSLAANIDRVLAKATFPAKVALEDGAGSLILTSPIPSGQGVKSDHKQLRLALRRAMFTAHPGAVATLTTYGPEMSSVVTAEGGAFDNRLATPEVPAPGYRFSSSSDVRELAPGQRLDIPTRALRVVAAGDLEIRTAGAPGEFQAPFAAPICTIPIPALELGPKTTATVVAVF